MRKKLLQNIALDIQYHAKLSGIKRKADRGPDKHGQIERRGQRDLDGLTTAKYILSGQGGRVV